MKKNQFFFLFAGILALSLDSAFAQFPNANANKAAGSNYQHAPNTIIRTEADSLVVKVKGSGAPPVILITDYMQDDRMYDELISRHDSKAEFHIIIPAGMGGTPAYEWPAEPEDFVSRPWTSTFEEELIDYIQTKKLSKPAIVATWPFGMNAALHLASTHPDKIGKILIIGQTQRTPFFRVYSHDSMQPGDFDIEKQRSSANSFITFWKNVDTHTWFSNSWQPSFYSNDREFGLNIAYKRAFHEIPIIIRYWSEYIIADLSKVLSEVTIPVHVLSVTHSEKNMQNLLERAGMSNLKANEVLNTLHCNTRNDWGADKENIEITFFEDSGLFIWYDTPHKFDEIFNSFLEE